MRRDLEFLRHLLLQIEQVDTGNSLPLRLSSDEPSATLYRHLKLLHDAGLIDGVGVSTLSEREFRPKRLTWAGHEFLDSVRDPEIWRKTKNGVEVAGGFTFDLIKDLAKGFTKMQIKKYTGVEL